MGDPSPLRVVANAIAQAHLDNGFEWMRDADSCASFALSALDKAGFRITLIASPGDQAAVPERMIPVPESLLREILEGAVPERTHYRRRGWALLNDALKEPTDA